MTTLQDHLRFPRTPKSDRRCSRTPSSCGATTWWGDSLLVRYGVAGPTGRAALMRIEPAHRVIEVGGIVYSPRLQRTRGATEAMYLLARHVFDELGYRRYEWKCNALNQPSRSAARRLGFTFEGIFRQHLIIKSRSRDTAWFSMLDTEWPDRKTRFERWLAPDNFDADGHQLSPLSAS